MKSTQKQRPPAGPPAPEQAQALEPVSFMAHKEDAATLRAYAKRMSIAPEAVLQMFVKEWAVMARRMFNIKSEA